MQYQPAEKAHHTTEGNRILRKMKYLLIFGSQPSSLPVAIHPAEVFPLFLSIAVVTQSLIFIVVQSGGLKTEFAARCRRTAELVWPGKCCCLAPS